jgi:hypothetical protein
MEERSSQHLEPHLRQSLRVPKHDYVSIGTYFVTMCAERREPLFEIPELRTILTETWCRVAEKRYRFSAP